MKAQYLTTSIDDPVFSENYSYISGKYIGEGNKAYAYLNFLSCDFLLATTPHLDVLQWKKSKNVKHYSHIIHLAGGALLYNLFALDYFDSVILPGEEEVKEIRLLEQARNLKPKELIVAGSTFFDYCSKKIETIPKEETGNFTVLLSPTWGPNGLLSLFGSRLIEPLIKTGWQIIIRPHPQSLISEKNIIDPLLSQFKDNPNIEWDYSNENIYTLSRSDIMLSDYSGIIFDFVFLFDKPVIVNLAEIDFRRLDAQDIQEEPFFLKALKKIGIQLDASNLCNIKKIIENLNVDSEHKRIRNEIKNIMWQYQGQSAELIVNFIEKTINA